MRMLFYFAGIVLSLSAVFLLQANNNCYDDSSLEYSVKGCFDSLAAASYNAFAPLIFNLGLISLILPSVVDLNYKDPVIDKGDLYGLGMNQRATSAGMWSFRMIITYEGWRVFYKLAITVYILHYMVLFWFFASVSQ